MAAQNAPGLLPESSSSIYESLTCVFVNIVTLGKVELMKKRHGGPQIVSKLRQADILIGQGKSVPEVCKELDVTDATYYRWRQKYGGMSPDMVKQLRAVQKENVQLRKLVADQALDISILKVAAEGNF